METQCLSNVGQLRVGFSTYNVTNTIHIDICDVIYYDRFKCTKWTYVIYTQWRCAKHTSLAKTSTRYKDMCPRTLCHSGSEGTVNEGTFFDKTLEVSFVLCYSNGYQVHKRPGPRPFRNLVKWFICTIFIIVSILCLPKQDNLGS